MKQYKTLLGALASRQKEVEQSIQVDCTAGHSNSSLLEGISELREGDDQPIQATETVPQTDGPETRERGESPGQLLQAETFVRGESPGELLQVHTRSRGESPGELLF